MAMTEGLTQAERERLSSYLTAAHDQVLVVVRGFSDQQLDFKSGADRWSISENVEHMTIVHNLVLNYILQVIASPTTSKQSAWIGREEEMLGHIRDRSNPLKVPEIGAPKNQWPHNELLRRLEETRNRLVEFVVSTDASLRNFCFPHPIFGEKDCYQWLLGIGAHCERHLAQIREVTSSVDFPKAAAQVSASSILSAEESNHEYFHVRSNSSTNKHMRQL